jgi:thiol-disulfide isomerase/thioredoxin
MKYLNKPVAYLQKNDFDTQGNLVNPQIPKNVPVLIFIHSNWCPHCMTAKPAFQSFAEKNSGKVFSATIQADGDMPGEKELGLMLNKIDPNFVGFPGYVVYMNGKMVGVHNGGRGVGDLESFLRI